MLNFVKKRTRQETGNVLKFPVDQTLNRPKLPPSSPRLEPVTIRPTNLNDSMESLIKRHFIRKLHVVEHNGKNE